MLTKKGPQVEVETYRNEKAFEKDAEKRLAAGWELTSQSGLDQQVAKIRTATRLLLFSPLVIVGGRSKKGDSMQAVWTKPA